jgi:hypothetical protein
LVIIRNSPYEKSYFHKVGPCSHYGDDFHKQIFGYLNLLSYTNAYVREKLWDAFESGETRNDGRIRI